MAYQTIQTWEDPLAARQTKCRLGLDDVPAWLHQRRHKGNARARKVLQKLPYFQQELLIHNALVLRYTRLQAVTYRVHRY